jgi:hypothetical protein
LEREFQPAREVRRFGQHLRVSISLKSLWCPIAG